MIFIYEVCLCYTNYSLNKYNRSILQKQKIIREFLHSIENMLYNKNQSLNYRERSFRHHNGNIFKAPQRLIFPIKQTSDGYVGRKQFRYKNQDGIILGEDKNAEMIRRDKLDVADIEGASPNLKIQSIQNINRHFGQKRSSSLQNINDPKRRLVTDSLDKLVSSSKMNVNEEINQVRPYSRRQKTESYELQQSPNYVIPKIPHNLNKIHNTQKYLHSRNSELTKQHILGLYSENSKLHNPQLHKNYQERKQKQALYINPTYLSSFKI